ncbi:hypothetical protein N7457_004511 [Penicillium paradoxum]|uniref:uncharacterized protein n=1 Tax=Penicillium paradoxum TaxID=176176 RepID=UPI002547F8A1|nr:uncharacterized protein N7457_004511 [Penicillium paradoxum]KAJ5782737.1 hypothetical protein N7457_004511 [Penicillium paradoxum]
MEDEIRLPLPEWSSSAEGIQYQEHFVRMIENKQPNQVMDAMTDPRSAWLVGSMPQSIFLDALHLLSPAHFVEPYLRPHHMLHEWGVRIQGLKTLAEVFDDFTKGLLTIMQYRVAAGYPPQLAEYTHLLACARAMGNGPLAEELWTAMDGHDIHPNLVCYNHYMAAKIWDHCYVGKESYNLRMLPYTYRKRRMESRNPGWRGYATGANSLKRIVLDIFSQMSQAGISGDEETYVNVILAACRVGDGTAAKNTLNSVWNINVDAIVAGDDSKLPEVVPYEPGSSLYPTERLLFAVAHAFGTNNSIDTAVRTVEFIASSYKLKISAKVWSELFERTYALSVEHTRRQANDGRRGRVPREMVHTTFQKMTTYPHNIPATVPMYRYTTQTYKRDGYLEACKTDMRKAYDILSATRAKRKEARDSIMRWLQPALDRMGSSTDRNQGHNRPAPDQSLLQSPMLAEAIHKYDILRLEVFQQIYLLQRMAFAIIGQTEWRDTSISVWDLQERPKLLEEWKDFLPECNRYIYDSGTLEFWGGTKSNTRYMSRHGFIHARRRPDHPDLFHPVEHKFLDDRIFWNLLLTQYPQLDQYSSPLNRLYSFQVERSENFDRILDHFHTRIDYPDDHPLSEKENPEGGLYGRIHALGLEVDPQRTMFWGDGNPWNC